MSGMVIALLFVTMKAKSPGRAGQSLVRAVTPRTREAATITY
jgi:hypothetical protein